MNGATQTAIYGGAATGAPWWIVLAIVAYPGVLAMVFTMAAVIMVRRINRAEKNPPLRVRTIVYWTLVIGTVFGPMCQYGFQRLAAWLVGAPVFWELVVVAPVVTGIASMVAYELLRWQAKTRWPRLYAVISVKHRESHGHVGDSPPSDLTLPGQL